jgi:hypothetical protein
MYETKVRLESVKGELHRTEQKAKEAEQLAAVLQGKEEELQLEREALGEARSQLELMDIALQKRRLAPSASICRWRTCRHASLRLSRMRRRLRGSPLP